MIGDIEFNMNMFEKIKLVGFESGFWKDEMENMKDVAGLDLLI